LDPYGRRGPPPPDRYYRDYPPADPYYRPRGDPYYRERDPYYDRPYAGYYERPPPLLGYPGQSHSPLDDCPSHYQAPARPYPSGYAPCLSACPLCACAHP
jgi:hypothetical protein